jgi:effector-binding domain-containing protein
MKKILKGLAIVVGVLAAVFILAGLLGPKHFKMERRAEINAPRSVVFTQVANYHLWLKWSPWADIDPNATYEYFGTDEQVGAGYRWKGNDKVGEGEMKLLEIEPGTKVVSQLDFIKPFKSTAIATFTLSDGAGGVTNISWAFDQDVSFMMRPFMLAMNMKKMLAADFDKGLSRLKVLCENSKPDQAEAALEVKEVEWEGKTYVTYRKEVDMKDLSPFFQEHMPKTFAYVKSKDLTPGEPVTGLYYSWDTVKHKTDVAVAVVVKDPKGLDGGYKAVTVDRSKALLVDYYGAYDGIPAAHAAIGKYVAEKKLTIKNPVIEEYVGDPVAEKDPKKVLTKVYYLID